MASRLEIEGRSDSGKTGEDVSDIDGRTEVRSRWDRMVVGGREEGGEETHGNLKFRTPLSLLPRVVSLFSIPFSLPHRPAVTGLRFRMILFVVYTESLAKSQSGLRPEREKETTKRERNKEAGARIPLPNKISGFSKATGHG